MPELIQMTAPNSSLTFNVSYGNFSWNNNSRGLSLTRDMWSLDENSVFTIRIRGDFSRVNRSALNMTQIRAPPRSDPRTIVLNYTFTFAIFSST